MNNHLETLNGLFNSFTEVLLCQQQQKDHFVPPQPIYDSSPATALMPPLNLVRTMNNTQVDHGIESTIDKTNVDKDGRTKNTPLSYKAKQKEFEAFCDVVYARKKWKKDKRSTPTS